MSSVRERALARVRSGPDAEYWRLREAKVRGEAVDFGFRRKAGRVNVGLVQPGAWSGGAERYQLQVFQGLDLARYHVVGTATMSDPSESPIAGDYRSIAPIAHGRAAMANLAATCDVLLAWGLPELPAMIGEPGRARIVLMSHGRCPWTAAATSHATRPDVVAVGIASEDCRHTVPEGLTVPVREMWSMAEEERTRPRISREEQRRLWGVPDGHKVLLHVARPSPEKRCGLAVRGLPDGWCYVCVGDAPHSEEYRAKVLAASPPGRAIFAGFTADVGSALHTADAAFLASSNEGCSLAALECHLAGLPVVATPIGLYAQYPEFIKSVPLDARPGDIRRAILALDEDAEATRAMVAAARAHTREHHSPEAFHARWSEMLALASEGLLKGNLEQTVPSLARKAAAIDSGDPDDPYGPGTVLADHLKSWKINGCGACREAARRMNRLGPAGVIADLDRIVADIRTRTPRLVPTLAIREAVAWACRESANRKGVAIA